MRWVNEGHIVVGFVWAGVGDGRGFQGRWVVGIGVFIQNGNHGCGSDEADGWGREHIVNRGGVGAEAGGEGVEGGCHGGPVGWVRRGCVVRTVKCGD